jgi:hypothetical protein
MLDDVERRRFLVQPAGKHPAPFADGPLDVDLDEGAGQPLRFPRRGRLAGAQAYDHVLPPHRLAGVERDVLHDAVALVEDGENGDALRHRGHARLVRTRRDGGVGDDRSRRILLVAAAARRKGERDQHRCRQASHAYSGIQGS